MAREKSPMRKLLEEGCIGAFYTLSGWFFKVYPAFDIDKVRFSFAEKGKSGAGFDVYVGTDDFSLLCDDIRSGVLARHIQNDTGQYPSAWKYITGENASKQVAIGKSQKGGVLVQGRDTMQKKTAFVPLQTYSELRKLAFWYDVLSGKMPVVAYYKDMRDLFWKAYRERSERFSGN